ncbi:MAG: hypothetical protein DRR19_16940 [Candidatus Parabeggiatoa sp. nov. 1]|nr:MAG: hypothetical protein DRR19_16940 [Gammaproteobacteria bacterium]
MKKPAILATLTLLAPPMMAADDPCNPNTGGTFHSCITFMLQRIGQLEKENQAQQAKIQALEMRLSLTDGLVAKLTSAFSVSSDGNVQVKNLEVSGTLKTTEPVQVQIKTFKVGGDFDKFYPIVFSDDGYYVHGTLELEIWRSSVHIDSSWRGSLLSRFTLRSYGWGHGAAFAYAEIHQSNNKFVASYTDFHYTKQWIVWLRGGGTTYSWRSNHPVTLVDFKAEPKTLNTGYPPGSQHYHVTEYQVKTKVDPALDKWHVYPWTVSQ